MLPVQTEQPPGAVCLASGEIARYGVSLQCLERLRVPNGSLLAWYMGVLVAENLNSGLTAMMENPALQWAWIMGDDHTFEPDCLLRLLDREVDVVAPLCLNRLPPFDPTIVEHDHQPTGRMKYLEDLPTSGLYTLRAEETCGDAGLLVRRRVLDAIPFPWYDHRVSGAIAAEDQAWVQRIKDAGFDVHIDLDVQIGHIGQVLFAPVLKGDHWEIRMVGGGMRYINDMRPAPRADDAFRIAAE